MRPCPYSQRVKNGDPGQDLCFVYFYSFEAKVVKVVQSD